MKFHRIRIPFTPFFVFNADTFFWFFTMVREVFVLQAFWKKSKICEIEIWKTWICIQIDRNSTSVLHFSTSTLFAGLRMFTPAMVWWSRPRYVFIKIRKNEKNAKHRVRKKNYGQVWYNFMFFNFEVFYFFKYIVWFTKIRNSCFFYELKTATHGARTI